MFAVLARDWDMVSKLIKDGADLFAGHNENALDVAKMIKGENLSRLVNIFVEKHGANGVVHTYGRTIPLIVMAWAHGYEEVERLLVEHGAEPVHVDKFWANPTTQLNDVLERIVYEKKQEADLKSSDTQMIDDLVNIGGIDLPFGIHGISLLQFAAGRGLTGIVKLLIDNDADVNLPDRHGGRALMSANQLEKPSTVELLLANGADPNLADKNGDTALTWASRHGYTKLDRYTKLVEILLANSTAQQNTPQANALSH